MQTTLQWETKTLRTNCFQEYPCVEGASVSDQEIPNKYVFINDSVTSFLLLEIQGIFMFPYMASRHTYGLKDCQICIYELMIFSMWSSELQIILNNQPRLIYYQNSVSTRHSLGSFHVLKKIISAS